MRSDRNWPRPRPTNVFLVQNFLKSTISFNSSIQLNNWEKSNSIQYIILRRTRWRTNQNIPRQFFNGTCEKNWNRYPLWDNNFKERKKVGGDVDRYYCRVEIESVKESFLGWEIVYDAILLRKSSRKSRIWFANEFKRISKISVW